MKKILLLLTALMTFSCWIFAQTKTVSGTVVSAKDQQPVFGANVAVKGFPNYGTTTDANGKYSFSVPSSASKLIISLVGMEPIEVKAGTGVNTEMNTDLSELQGVVVTGMTKTDKRLFTGATDKLDASKVKLDGLPDVSRALEGRSAGVSVSNVSGTFGTAPKITVRGATSIYGSSKPLWVVDGVIMEDVREISSDDLSSGDAITLISSAIAGLNADDIESFQILKDGSATSIYGARAMAGVIVVTTKKGKVGSNKITYTGEYTYRMKPSYRDFNIMNSQEQMGIYKELEANGYLNISGVYNSSNWGVYGKMYSLINSYQQSSAAFALPNTQEAKNAYLRQAEYRNTDWFNLLFNNNVAANHAIGFSSGTEKASYYTSMSFMDDPGWSKQSAVKRYTSNLNALYRISDKLSLNLIGNGAYRKQKAPGTLSQDVDPVYGKVKRDFDINPYSYALNTSRTLDADTYYQRNYAPFNILNELNTNYIDLNIVDLRFQGELKWKVVKGLEAAALLAYKYSSTIQGHSVKDNSNQAMAYRAMDNTTMRNNNPWLYTDPDNPNSLPISVLPKGGLYNENKYNMNGTDFRGTLTYNNVFNKYHIVNLFGGMELNSVDRFSTSFDGIALQYEMGMLPAYDYRYFKQKSEENEQYYSLTNTRNRQLSFFGTSTYSYQGKYIVNGTLRYEGTNRLGKARSARWLPTWNISGAWNMHNEKFFEVLRSTLSNLTLKASYSLTADRGPSSVSNSRVVIGSYNPWRPFTEVKESGLQINDLENSELTYEKKHELNIGVDMGFLKNRINLAIDWYKRNNFDLIGPIQTMGVGGQITKYGNVASMKSGGIEFTLSTKNIQTNDFRWNTDFIFSKTKNEVTKFESNARVIDMITGTGFTMVGYPVRSLFSLNFQGLNSEGLPTFINEENKVIVKDINFQERIKKSHLIYEGPTDPTITGSLGNVFTYKNFRLNLFITYAMGNVVRLDPVFASVYSDLTATPREFKNRWTLSGDEAITNIPVIADRRLNQRYGSNLSYGYNAYNYSTVRAAKGDFIRMKEISFAYDFPQSIVRRLKASDMSLKIQATNLFLIYADKKLNGQDPEFFNTGGVAAPIPKQFTMTLRLGI